MIDQSVGDVMTQSVRTITPAVTARGVATLFAEHNIGSVVVIDPETSDPLGIVTESDIMREVAGGADTESLRVESFLTAPIVTVDRTADIHTAADLMKEHSIRRLPVIEDTDLLGILTTTDLTHYLPRIRNTILRDRSQFAGH